MLTQHNVTVYSYSQIILLIIDAVISACVELEGELSETEGYLRAMDIEFKTLPSAEKRGAQQKANDYKEEYKELLQRYQTAKFHAEAQALKGGPSARTKLLNANQKLDQSTAMLEQSRMILAQTEQVGNTIISDMENQKETLVSASDKVKETRQFTVDAKRVLSMMGRRAVMHKICVGFTILVLFAGICVIIYFGFLKKNLNNNSGR
jgi:vesicle transport through interaction with t-SNAREs 1